MARAQTAFFGAQVLVWVRSRGALIALESELAAPPLTPEARARAVELELAVSRVARYGVFRPKCLARSVALHRLLGANGIGGSRIRIGVRQESGNLIAHAWVTLEERVLGDSPAFVSRFQEIADARLARFA